MYNSQSSPNCLNYHDTYTCPVCRHGQISGITMMDAFGCYFCNTIFTANLEQQVLKKADSQPPLVWYWNGKTWQGGYQPEVNLGWGYWLTGIAFVTLPSALVGLAAYLFPPTPDSVLSWLPFVWALVTFFAHLSCIVWLVLEYYQFPLSAYLRALQRYFSSRFN